MSNNKLYVKLPSKYQAESYLQAFEQALYRLLFVYDSEFRLEDIKENKKGGITTRIRLSDTGNKHFKLLMRQYRTSKIDTALHTFLHIENNQSLYLIGESQCA